MVHSQGVHKNGVTTAAKHYRVRPKSRCLLNHTVLSLLAALPWLHVGLSSVGHNCCYQNAQQLLLFFFFFKIKSFLGPLRLFKATFPTELCRMSNSKNEWGKKSFSSSSSSSSIERSIYPKVAFRQQRTGVLLDCSEHRCCLRFRVIKYLVTFFLSFFL